MAEDDEVGYGKPPQRTRFRKGRSGNPSGRPKGVRNLKTDLQEELQEKVTVREGGRERRLTKQRLFLKQLVEKAAKGDQRAIDKLLQHASRMLDDEQPSAPSAPLSPEEEEVMAALQRRFLGPASGPAAEAVAGPTAQTAIESEGEP